MKWFDKNLWKIAFIIIIGITLWVVIAFDIGFILLTKANFNFNDFLSDKKNIGLIFSAIGGVTLPLIGLISIVLLFLTLTRQIESDNKRNDAANFKLIYEELILLKESLKQFSYNNFHGREAYISFSNYAKDNYDKDKFNNEDDIVIKRFDLSLWDFHKVFFILEKLHLNDDYKEILIKELNNIFSKNLVDALMILQRNYGHNENSERLYEGKLDQIAKNLQDILDEIKKNLDKYKGSMK